ncbi:hypothetical protein Pmani_019216 [Petrolisthes manimaculis]|uniref:Uncharacterized protein n=1 Tax=Petrolisthes manimaculis TaxID=1843537 RepID=A0AAE1U7M1_9EUCA|nr:hypothetical protein Pmani_019216 [Petrolisthes manimaculis]
MLLLLLLTLAVTKGEVTPFRPPVNGYAGVNPSGQQAVLVDPTMAQPASPVTYHNTRRPSVNFQSHATTPDTQNVPSLAQRLRLERPKLSRRPVNGSSLILQRLRQQIEGKRSGPWKTYLDGVSRRRVRPGLSRLGGGAGVSMRRRRPSPTNQRRTPSGVLRHRLAMQPKSQGKQNEYLVKWHSTYSGVNTTNKQIHTTEVPERGDSRRETVHRYSTNQYNNDGNLKSITKKSVFSITTKPPEATGSHNSGKVPSVHDMTSMHYKDTDPTTTLHNEDSDVPVTLKKVHTEDSHRPSGGPSSHPTDGKDILGSIQSIFQAAKSDEDDLASIKTVSHGNASPKPLDIFSGVSPTYGFKPSDNVFGESDNQGPQIQASTLSQQESAIPSHLTKGNTLYASEVPPEPILLASQEPTTGDFVVHVGRPLPVSSDPDITGPERRMAGEGDILLEEDGDDIIVGRPATLIEAPSDVPSPPQPITITTALPPPISHVTSNTNTNHYVQRQQDNNVQNLMVDNVQNYQPQSIPLSYSQNNLNPLLEYIKVKYRPEKIPAVPFSVSSLQSIIQAGRVPQVFRREDVMKHIQSDHMRYQRPAVNRLGEPYTTSMESVRAKPQRKTDTNGRGQFVALSSLALLAAFCGYLLFLAPGSQVENKVMDPIKKAVEEARSGLNLIIEGLDEYEGYIGKDEHKTEKEKAELQHNFEDSKPTEDIPTILTKIWKTVVPPEVTVSSSSTSNIIGERKLVDASALIRGNKKKTSGYRQPHAIPMDQEGEVDAELRQLNATINASILRTTTGLTSVATSLVNRFISSKTVRKIISQLKIPVWSARRDTTYTQIPKSDSLQRPYAETPNTVIQSIENLATKDVIEKDNHQNVREQTISLENERHEQEEAAEEEKSDTETMKQEIMRDNEHSEAAEAHTSTMKPGTEQPELITFLHVVPLTDEVKSSTPKITTTVEVFHKKEGTQNKSVDLKDEEKIGVTKTKEEEELLKSMSNTERKEVEQDRPEKKEQKPGEMTHEHHHKEKSTTQKNVPGNNNNDNNDDDNDDDTTDDKTQQHHQQDDTSLISTTTTTTAASKKKLVILNNLLHVQHHPEAHQQDPVPSPRTSAFLNNIALRPLPHSTTHPQ